MAVHIETLKRVTLYSPAQIDLAISLAYALNRGKLVLLEPPKGTS